MKISLKYSRMNVAATAIFLNAINAAIAQPIDEQSPRVELKIYTVGERFATMYGSGSVPVALRSRVINNHMLLLGSNPFLNPIPELANPNLFDHSNLQVGDQPINFAYGIGAGRSLATHTGASIYIGNGLTTGDILNGEVSGQLSMNLPSGYTLKTPGASGPVYHGHRTNGFTAPPVVGFWQIVESIPDPSIKASWLLASVASASNPQPSGGEALGAIINYQRQGSYLERKNALAACAQDINCDYDTAVRAVQQDFKQVNRDIGTVVVEIGAPIVTAPIGMTSVDETSWNNTILAQGLSFIDFVNNIGAMVTNVYDFLKEIKKSHEPAPTVSALRQGFLLEPNINTPVITGTIYWDGDGQMSWAATDLLIDISAESGIFDDSDVGTVVTNVDTYFPLSQGFVAAEILRMSTVDNHDVLHLSLRSINVLSQPIASPVPELAEWIMLLLGLGSLFALRFRREKTLPRLVVWESHRLPTAFAENLRQSTLNRSVYGLVQRAEA